MKRTGSRNWHDNSMRKSFSWKVERGTVKGNERNIGLRYEGTRIVADIVADIEIISISNISPSRNRQIKHRFTNSINFNLFQHRFKTKMASNSITLLLGIVSRPTGKQQIQLIVKVSGYVIFGFIFTFYSNVYNTRMVYLKLFRT